MTWRTSVGPLRDRGFRYFFCSQAVNIWGTTMAPVALAFAVLAIEDSPAALGQVLAARSIPMVLFLLLGGVIADRLGRRLVIQLSNAVCVLSQATAAALVISGNAELWQLVVIEAVNGTAAATAFPAMQGMIPQLVPRAHLQQANALLSLARGALFALGPTTAALLVVTVGPGWALAVDAGTWLGSLLLLIPVRVPHAAPAAGTGVLVDLRAGWSFFRRTEWLWVVVLAFGALNAIKAGAWNTLGPSVAKDTIGIAAWGYVLSALAIGLVATSAVMLRVRIRRPLRAGMLGCLAFAPPLLLLGIEPRLVPLVATAFLAGAGLELFGLGWSLAMQEHVPEEMLSRAYSYDALGSLIAIPVGQLAFGPLGEAFGAQPVLVASGVGYAAICLLTLLSRDVRRLERLPDAVPVSSTAP